MSRVGLALLAAVVLAFPLVILGKRAWFYWDHGVLAYPFIYFQKAAWLNGEIPLWNPYSHAGVPFLAQWGPAVLYPFSLIFLLLPLPWSLGVFELSHLVLGGLGMYWLARQVVGNRFGAVLAGFGYVFNGLMLSGLTWPNYPVVLAWAPWVIGWSRRAWRNDDGNGGRAMIAAVLCGSMQMLAGVPEIIVFTWTFVALWMAWDGIWNRATPGQWRKAVRLAVVMALTGCVCAVQLLPFLQLLGESQRTPGFQSERWPMPLWGLGNLLVPGFHYFQTPQGMFVQEGQSFLATYYPGILLLALGCLALLRGRKRAAWGLAAGLVLMTWLAMGERAGLLVALKAVFPFLGVARFPVKFLFIGLFALPLLAALGWQWLEAADNAQRRRAWLSVLGALGAGIVMVLIAARVDRWQYDIWEVAFRSGAFRLLMLGMMGWLLFQICNWHGSKRCIGEGLILALMLLDAVTAVPRVMPTTDSAVMQAGIAKEALGWKDGPKLGQGRVFISPAAEQKLLRSEVPDIVTDFLNKRRALWSNLNVLDEVPKVNGAATLQLRAQAELQREMYSTNRVSLPSGLLDFLGVSQVLTNGIPAMWEERKGPTSWVSGGQRPAFATPEETLKAMLSEEFDPRRTVYLPSAVATQAIVRDAPTSPVIIHSTEWHLNRVIIDVESTAPAWLVVSQAHYPCWMAAVDGKPVTLWKANHAFQALEIGTGRQRVELCYVDRRLQLGAVISGATLLGLAVAFVRLRRRAA